MTAAGHSEAAVVDALEKNTSWPVGSIGYLVSTSWWNIWVQYSGYTGPSAAPAPTLLQLPGGGGPRPGPISNADLLPLGYVTAAPQLPGAPAPQPQPQQSVPDAEAIPLRPGLVEQRDFVVVSAASWQRLHSWYGGGPAIGRRVVAEAAPGPSGQSGSSERWGRLALYPLRLEVSYRTKDGKQRSTAVSMDPEASLAALKARACAALGVAESEVALWDYTGGRLVKSLELAPPPPSGETSSATAATGTATGRAAAPAAAPMAVEDGILAAPAAAADSADRTGSGGGTAAGSTSMEVDVAAPAAAAEPVARELSKDGAMGQPLREIPLLEGHLLRLRRTDAPAHDSDADDDGDDACGSDNDNDTGPLVGRKKAGKKAGAGSAAGTTRLASAEAAAAAAVRRASAAGSTRSDGGSGSAAPALPATARTSGGGSGLFGSNRLGNQRSAWGAQEDNVISRDGQPPGLAGLSNLGNTCFMNSSLQCLAHAVPLMSAFLGGAYMHDLNRTNPLGMKGELAEAFGALMEQLWRGGLSAVTPRAFKAKIGRFAPQFSGYAQHDSQEFLAFLLDGLHEDTNRIKVKPYIEEKDQPGRPDDEVAAEAWANYRARNDSLVVDHFQGLFKSTVDCPKCGFNSVKFDPFMYLSLPLPESRRRMVEVVLVRIDGSELPCRMALELPSGATLADLLRASAKAGGLPAEVLAAPESHLVAARPLRPSPSAYSEELVLLSDSRMRLADAMEAGSTGVSSYSLRSSANADSGLVVYYYPDASRGPRAEGLAPVIVHFKRPDIRRTGSGWTRTIWCGAPLVLYMPEDQPPYDPSQLTKVYMDGNRSRYEWQISGDCPLLTALVEVLRPIQRMPIEFPQQPQPQAATTASAAADGALTEAVGDGELQAAAVAPAHGGGGSIGPASVSEVTATAAAPMEDDRPAGGSDVGADAEGAEALRPSTPAGEGDRNAAVAGTAGADAGPRRCCSNGGAAAGGDKHSGGAGFDGSDDQMEGLEPLVAAPAVDAVPMATASGLIGGGAAADGGSGDASMSGAPQPDTSGAMEDDVATAGAALPAVIIAGPPHNDEEDGAGGLGPTAVQPFDMWAAQPPPQFNWGADDEPGAHESAAVTTGAAAADADATPFTGPPFTLKLCNTRGESARFDTMYEGQTNQEQNRHFLLVFNDAPSPAAESSSADGAAATGPYAPELLDSPLEHPSLREQRQRTAAGPQPVSLDACMTTFLQPERLAESDAWYCPRCKSHVCADKKLDLWSLPEVLVVHLKRFSYTRYSRNKLDTRVDFPLHSLDLGPYVLRPQGVPPVYDLFAVSNHYGSLGGGHYTAYAKMPSPPPPPLRQAPVSSKAPASAEQGPLPTDRWYCFDDSHVSAVDPEAVRSPAAYVLFYRRRSEAAADPPDVGDLLEHLRQQRAAQQQAAEEGNQPADGLSARGTGGQPGGSPGSGSDGHPDQDHDQGQDQDHSRGAFDQSRRGGALGQVSIAAAAVAAQAARGGTAAGASATASGGAAAAAGDDEELEVEGRSMAAFTLQSRDTGPAGGLRYRPVGGNSGCDGAGSSDSFGEAVVGPSSPAPIPVNTAYGGAVASGEGLPYGGYGAGGSTYDASEFEAFALAGGGSGGGGTERHGDGSGVLLQPPGSPAEPDLDMNNPDLTGLYQEVEAMDVVRDRHSGSDMASAGGNDLDQDDDVVGEADGDVGPFADRRSGGGGGSGGLAIPPGRQDSFEGPSKPGARGGLNLMSTSPM